MVFSLILVVGNTIYRLFSASSRFSVSSSKMPPPGARNGPLVKSSGENAHEVFQKISQSQGKISIVNKVGTEVDPRVCVHF
jgi:hypothetical protein